MSMGLRIDERSKTHNKLLHYCNIYSLEAIINDRTLKCNNISNVNDIFEQKRKGIEEYLKDCFVSCFCNYQQEIVPFWIVYGGECSEQKILLKFNNFSNDIYNKIYTDYFLTEQKKKMKIYLDTKISYSLDDVVGEIKDNSEYDASDFLWQIKINDIDYRPIDDAVFHKTYFPSIDPPFIINAFGNDGKDLGPVPCADISTLGCYKTNHWEYEKETRIICQLSLFGRINKKKLQDYIFIRLKENFFEGLEIVLNPWAETDFEDNIIRIINNSSLSPNIKKSISITKSELQGLIK